MPRIRPDCSAIRMDSTGETEPRTDVPTQQCLDAGDPLRPHIDDRLAKIGQNQTKIEPAVAAPECGRLVATTTDDDQPAVVHSNGHVVGKRANDSQAATVGHLGICHCPRRRIQRR